MLRAWFARRNGQDTLLLPNGLARVPVARALEAEELTRRSALVVEGTVPAVYSATRPISGQGGDGSLVELLVEIAVESVSAGQGAAPGAVLLCRTWQCAFTRPLGGFPKTDGQEVRPEAGQPVRAHLVRSAHAVLELVTPNGLWCGRPRSS